MTQDRLDNVIPFPRTRARAAAPPPLPSPAEVFALWFKSIPPGADLELAATLAIARIDQRAPGHPDTQLLRALLSMFVSGQPFSQERSVF